MCSVINGQCSWQVSLRITCLSLEAVVPLHLSLVQPSVSHSCPLMCWLLCSLWTSWISSGSLMACTHWLVFGCNNNRKSPPFLMRVNLVRWQFENLSPDCFSLVMQNSFVVLCVQRLCLGICCSQFTGAVTQSSNWKRRGVVYQDFFLHAACESEMNKAAWKFLTTPEDRVFVSLSFWGLL